MHHFNLIQQHTLNNSQSNLNHHNQQQQQQHYHQHNQSTIQSPPNSSIKRIKTDVEDDLELLAKKKKNADAQAAFRLRRQTYIKSLEDTVTELQNAVKEMEVLVKTANLEVKIKCEQVSYLENKIKQNQNEITSTSNSSSSISHCNCCRFNQSNNSSTTTTRRSNTTKFLNQQTHSLSLSTQSNPNLPTTSSSINPGSNTTTANTPTTTNSGNPNPTSTIANHSILNSAPHTPNTLEPPSNDWSTASNSHRPYPTIITSSSPSHLLSDSRHSTNLEANRLYDRSSSNDHDSNQGSHSSNHYNPRCDITFLDTFNLNQSNPSPFYSSLEPVLNPNHHRNSTTTLEISSTYQSNPTTPRQLIPTSYPSSSSHSNKPYSLNYPSILDDHHHHHSHLFGYDDDHSQQQQQIKRKRDDEINTNQKLNGLPAKVARCEQTVMEVSKVVLQAKEQAQLVASEQQKRIMKLNSNQTF